MSQGKERESRVEQIRTQFRRKIRKEDLDEKFSTIRKRLMESEEN